MKTTITINLNGLLFHIEEEAYKALKKYLDNINGHFKNVADANEIVNDIEARIAELFNEFLGKSRQVINTDDITRVMDIIGDPKEIGDEEHHEKQQNSGKKKYYTYHHKRFYRDPDNRVFGGVCGGLGAYFHMDPVIWRIIFIVSFLVAGVGLFIYPILWLVIPKAETPAQKCEMRGEPFNLSNLGQNIKDEFNEVKNKYNL